MKAVTEMFPEVFPKLIDTILEVGVSICRVIVAPAGRDQINELADPVRMVILYTSALKEQNDNCPLTLPMVSATPALPFKSPPQKVDDEEPSSLPPVY